MILLINPHATLATISDSGHLIPMERPLALVNVVRSWLRDLKLSATQGRIKPGAARHHHS